MILVYSFIKRNQSRSVHKSWTVKETLRALESVGLEIVQDFGIVCYVSKEVPDDQAIQARKEIESRFHLVSRAFPFIFHGAF